MRLSYLFSGIAASCVILTATPAGAASDYFLKLEGVKGEASAAPATVEVLSWSWGASNPTSIGSSGLSAGKAASGGGKVNVQDLSATGVATASGGSGGAGKVNVQDLSVTKREAGTGMATGKRVAVGDLDGDGRADIAAAPPAGTDAELVVRYRESPTRAGACAKGKHFDKVTLSRAGEAVTLQDATVTACGGEGADRTMTVKGKTGHVTLIK